MRCKRTKSIPGLLSPTSKKPVAWLLFSLPMMVTMPLWLPPALICRWAWIECNSRIFLRLSPRRALVLQLEIPLETVKTLVAAGHNGGIPVVLNPAPAQPLPPETLRQLQILIANKNEASTLSDMNIDNPEGARTAATRLHEQGIPIAVITLGVQVVALAMDDGSGKTLTIYQPAPRVKVVDTTAAGDWFAGAFTVALTC